jgi:hypothetical protein
MEATGAPSALLTAAVPGPILFARFAYPPNRLGLCGPDAGLTLPDRLRDGRSGGSFDGRPDHGMPDAQPDPELRRIAAAFEGAWPYLELIAAENDRRDPLDGEVVEAYWLGNDLLRRVRPQARFDDLEKRFRPRTAPRAWPWLADKAGGASVVHHSFHVIEVLPRIGLIRGGLPPALLGVLESCLIRPARVESIGGDAMRVAIPTLRLQDGRLELGPATSLAVDVDGGFGDALEPGDDVAVHWGRICGRISAGQARRLRAITERNIAVANETL